MSFKIKTPNVSFTGIRHGVAIQNGEGHTTEVDVAQELKALGYEVDPDPAAPKPAKKSEPEKKSDADKK